MAKPRAKPATPARVETGSYRLVFVQGAVVIPLTDRGTFKTRPLARQALSDLIRWYRANGATTVHDRPLDDCERITLVRQGRHFTLSIEPVYRDEARP